MRPSFSHSSDTTVRTYALRCTFFLCKIKYYAFPKLIAYRKSWPRQNRVCSAAPDELPFGSWKILSSFLGGAAADFDVSGKIKDEASAAVSDVSA